MDAEKQSAINVYVFTEFKVRLISCSLLTVSWLYCGRFLGHFKPLDGKPEVWELDTDQRYSAHRYGQQYANENARYRLADVTVKLMVLFLVY